MTATHPPGHDDGFTLVETMVSVFVISVVMAALSTFFVTSVSLTNLQGATQVATQFATQAAGMVRTVKGSDLVDGRDATSSHTQWNNPVAGVAPYLADMNEVWDPSAATGAGAAAALPTTPRPATVVNNVPYLTYFYLGTCWQPVGGGSCAKTQVGAFASFFRVVVAITWRGRTCPQSLCSYVTATLVSNAPREPLFNINAPGAASLTITNPGNRTGTTGSTVNLPLAATNGTAPLTWSFTGLPPGLTGSPGGGVTGTLSSTADVYTVVVSVRDGAGVVDATSFTWTVAKPLPANATGLSYTRACAVVPTGVPTLRAVTKASGAASAGFVDVATPTTQPGDVLIAFLLSTNAGNPVSPVATGWNAATLRRGPAIVDNPATSATSNSAGVYWRAATQAMPPTYRFGWPITADSGTVMIASYSGADLTDPLAGVHITDQPGGTGITGTSLPVTSSPAFYVLAAMTTSTLPMTATTAMTTTDATLTARSAINATNGAGQVSLWDRVYPSTGATGTPPVSWGSPSRAGIAFSAVLRQRGTAYVDPAITLNWTPSADTSVTGYQITRVNTNTTIPGRSTATWTDTAAAADTGYTYSLKAVNAVATASGVGIAVPRCP